MTDTQAAMREFRFLDEKRKTNGLSPYEEQRWQGLASFLGIDLFTEAQSWGQWGADGQWYPYPGYEGYYPPEQAYGQNYAHYQTQDYPQDAYGEQGLVPQYDEAGQFVGNYPLAPADQYAAEGYAEPVPSDASYAQPWVPPYPPGVESVAPNDGSLEQGWPQPPAGDWPQGSPDFNFNSRPSSLDKSGDPVGDLRRALSLEASQSVTVPVEALTPETELPARQRAAFSNLVPWREAEVPSQGPAPAATPSLNPTTQPASTLQQSLAASVSLEVQTRDFSPAHPVLTPPRTVASSPTVWPKLEPLPLTHPNPMSEAISEAPSMSLESDGLAVSVDLPSEAAAATLNQTGEVEMVSDAFVEEVELSAEHQVPVPVSAAPVTPELEIGEPTVEAAPLQLTRAVTPIPAVILARAAAVEPVTTPPEAVATSLVEIENLSPTLSVDSPTEKLEVALSPSSALADSVSAAEMVAPSIEGESSFDVDVDGDESPAAPPSEPTVVVEMQALEAPSILAPAPEGSLLDQLVSVAEMSQVGSAFAETPAAEVPQPVVTQAEALTEPLPLAASLQAVADHSEEVPEPLASIDFVAENDVLPVMDDAPEATAPTSEEMSQAQTKAQTPPPFAIPLTLQSATAGALEEEIDVSFDASPSAPEPVSLPQREPVQPPVAEAPVPSAGESLPLVELAISAVEKAEPPAPEVLAEPVQIDAPQLRETPYVSSNTGLFAQMPPLAPALAAVVDVPARPIEQPVQSVSAVVSPVSVLAQHESEIIEGIVLDEEPAAAPEVIAAPVRVATPVPAPVPVAKTALAADSLDDLWPQDAPSSAPRARAPQAPAPRMTAQPAVPPTLAAAAPVQKPASNPVPQHVPQTVPEFFDRSGGHLRDSVISVPLPGEHRVILHTLEGQVKRGTLRNADLGDDTLELVAASSTERIARPRVKAIFFLLPAGGRLQPSKGAKVRVTFKDGRQVAGFSSDHKGMGPGFFVVPADNRTNTERIYIYRHGISGVVNE